MNREGTAFITTQSCVIPALQEALRQLESLVSRLNKEDFCQKKNETGSIGEHVRHSLDHISAVLHEAFRRKREAFTKLRISYDKRIRGTTLERNKKLCIERIQEIIQDIEEIRLELEIKTEEKTNSLLTYPVEIEHVITKEGETALFLSCLGREFMFVFHHLIHHNAMIAQHLHQLKKPVEPGFGTAPSTLGQVIKV